MKHSTDCPECRVIAMLLRAALPWLLAWAVSCAIGMALIWALTS